MDVTYRWVEGPTASSADWNAIEEVCAARGWMSLNPLVSRILLAEQGDRIVGFHVFQLTPFCGPLFVDTEVRGTGVAEALSDKMLEFLTDVQVRGFMVVAESRFAARLCEARGMRRVNDPVYVKLPAPSDAVIDDATGQGG